MSQDPIWRPARGVLRGKRLVKYTRSQGIRHYWGEY